MGKCLVSCSALAGEVQPFDMTQVLSCAISKRVYSSFIIVHSWNFHATGLFTMSQKCSIGLIFGKYGGHTICQKFPKYFLKQFCATLHWWPDALGCWSHLLLLRYMVYSEKVIQREQSPFNDVLRWTNGSNPYYKGTPHIIMQQPPACVTAKPYNQPQSGTVTYKTVPHMAKSPSV